MPFCTDRDLLLLEPNVFIDVPLAAQQRLRVSDGTLSGVTLHSALADFQSAQVNAGSVLLIDDVPHEVVARTDAHTLTVSLPRGDDAAEPLTVGDGSDLELIARTFEPQIALVHDMMLRWIGIDRDDAAAELNESAVLSVSLLRQLEALGTLEQVYSAAVALSGDNAILLHKAAEYRRRFREQWAASNVRIDLDGDGHADALRPLGVMRMRRV